MGQNEQVKDGHPAALSVDSAGQIIARGDTLQQIQTPYATAVSVQNKRDLKDVTRRCLEEAELGGEAFYYHWEVESTNRKTGEKTKSVVENGSINCALSAIRNWGNTAVAQRPIQETDSSYIFTSAVIDLETGFTLERPFRMDKNFPVYGRMDKYRKEDIRFQIGASKSIRNVVMNFVPKGLINKMVEAAMNSVRISLEKKIKKAGGEISKVIADMMVSFGRFRVTQEMIEKKIGLPVKNWDVETLVILTGDLRALKDGHETAESLYCDDRPEPQTGSMSADDMKPGDASTHQGYDDTPEQPTPSGSPKPKQADPPRKEPPPADSTPETKAPRTYLIQLLAENENLLGPEVVAQYDADKIQKEWSLERVNRAIKGCESMIASLKKTPEKEADKPAETPPEGQAEIPLNDKPLPKEADW